MKMSVLLKTGHNSTWEEYFDHGSKHFKVAPRSSYYHLHFVLNMEIKSSSLRLDFLSTPDYIASSFYLPNLTSSKKSLIHAYLHACDQSFAQQTLVE